MSEETQETPKEERQPWVYTPKTDAEIEQLAQDMAMGRVFTSMHLPADQFDMVSMIFMPLGLSDIESIRDMEKNEIYMFYEYLEKAGNRGVNGYPTFFSMKMLNKADTLKVMPKYREIVEFLESRKPKESA